MFFKCLNASLKWRCEFGFAVSIILEQGGRTPALGRLSQAPHLPVLWGNMAASQSSTCQCRQRAKPSKTWQGLPSRCQLRERWGTCWKNSSSAGRQHTQTQSPGKGCSLMVSWEPSLWSHVSCDYKLQGRSTDGSQSRGSEMPSGIIYAPWQNISQTNLTER